MNLLFLAPGLEKPSHLWMRRMARLLRPHIGVMAVAKAPSLREFCDYPVALMPATPPLSLRARNRLGMLRASPWEGFQDRWLARLLQRKDIDRVVVHFLTIAVRHADAWRESGKPVFVFCHGYDVTWDLEHLNDQRVHAENYVSRIVNLGANVTFIANSTATRSRLLAIGIPSERIRIHYLGVPVAESPKPHRDNGECEILYLGRLVGFKGPDLVIRAFECACEKGFSGRLSIAGDGPLRQVCESLVADSRYRHAIRLLGSVTAEEGAELRRRADIFTAHNQKGPVTNQEEAYGVSVIEAMAQGLPVVSGRNGSLPEIVRNHVDGILIPPGDVEAHADALLKLGGSSQLRGRMGASAWRRAKVHFNAEGEAGRLLAILDAHPEREAGRVFGAR